MDKTGTGMLISGSDFRSRMICGINHKLKRVSKEEAMNEGKERGKVWSIVLAGGEGLRTEEFVRRWLGYKKPKQYCANVKTSSDRL